MVRVEEQVAETQTSPRFDLPGSGDCRIRGWSSKILEAPLSRSIPDFQSHANRSTLCYSVLVEFGLVGLLPQSASSPVDLSFERIHLREKLCSPPI